MKANISKILISILLIILTVFSLTNVGNAASKATIDCPASVNLNSNFNVKLKLPADAKAAQANVTVTFSNGTTATGMITYLDKSLGASDDTPATIKASVVGKADIAITNIILSGAAGEKLETGGTLSTTITVVDPTPVNNTTNTTKPTTTNTTNTTKPTTTNTTNTTNTTTTEQYTTVNETVVTTERVNVRKSPNGDKIATVDKGTELKRTGVGNKGWSKVEYNGQTAYVSSQYLTAKSTKPTETEIKFTDVNETVYTTERVNIRKSPNGDKVTTVDAGTELKRTGTSTDWSRVEYNKQTAYVSSKYVTTTKPEVKVNDVDETTMYASKNCNLREGPSTDTKVVGSLTKGEKITKNGITSDKKWTRLKYDGKVVYVSSSLISSEKPKEEVENTVANTTNTTNTVANTVVENTINEEEVLAKIKEDVGVLPEVGINPAVVAYIVLSVAATIFAITTIYKNKKEN